MGKIENESQYQISKRILEELNDAILDLSNDPNKNPNRKILLLTSLKVAKTDIEKEISDFESLNKPPSN